MLDRNAVIELGKSFGRFMWFGLLALVTTFLGNLITSGALSDVNVTIFDQMFNLTGVIAVGVGFVIKAIDRYRHESDNTSSNGIAPSFLQR